MGCPALPGCGGMGGMGSGVDLGDAAAHPHPSYLNQALCRSPGCHGDPVPPPGDPQRPLPVWICCGVKDWGCLVSDAAVVSSRTRPSLPHPPLQTPLSQLCQATAPALLPRRHRFPALLQLLGTTLAVSAAPPGAWDPPARGRKPPASGDRRKRWWLLTPCEDLGPLPGRKALPALGTLRVQRGQGGPRCVVCGAAAAMPVTVTVTLPGPAPWGFRISGGRDFGKPITVSKVTEHGKAATGDLRPGDVIVTINGESTAEMLNVEAQNKIRQSPGQLRLDVERSPVPSLSHTNGDTLPEMLASHFQDTLQMPSESRSALRTLDPSLASLTHPPGSASSQPLEQEFTCPGLPQERRLSRQSSSQGAVLPPPPRPPSPELGAPQNPWATPRERRLSSPCPSTWPSQGSEPAMRRLEEDSEVYKMLQENRELRAAPRQSSTFRLLQEALEDEEGGGPAAPFPSRLSAGARKPVAGVQKLHVCEKCGSSIATQAVRIQDGRYRHPSCYTCADCGLSLKMRGHFWVGDELFCEKHARLRYQGPPGGPVPRPVSPRS
ncbi:PDZ and LIM domain protein 2 isoform X2 [Pyrgilauda ruficollis]|uniref:PDZ and LIM domain protein 2 isoform X2 n=1 Tax=Pyrgilauda ruficollis TaxID=221976 RepID=UPI001B881018|nr:PDZ and LIM domain protein 2 isoform X2 [Pyrgilauda ruficollis]